MALAYLSMIYVALGILAIIFQVLLYKGIKSKNSHFVFMANVLLSLVLAFIAYSSLPSNFTMQRVIAVITGLIAISAIGIRLKTKENFIISKLMLTISIIAGLIQIYI